MHQPAQPEVQRLALLSALEQLFKESSSRYNVGPLHVPSLVVEWTKNSSQYPESCRRALLFTTKLVGVCQRFIMTRNCWDWQCTN